MFKSDGNVIHFAAPKGESRLEHRKHGRRTRKLTVRLVHASVPSNTFAIYGNGEDKELTDLVPGILNQLGPDSLASLRKLAESYQNMQKAGEDTEKEDGAPEAEDDDAIPDLVDRTFEDKVE